MDIHLHGEINGIEAARYICENFFIPIIYITGDADISTVRSSIQKNTYGFLTKPITKDKLEISIEFAIAKHEIIKNHLK
jgi:DNA-binding NtrC family response regulator